MAETETGTAAAELRVPEDLRRASEECVGACWEEAVRAGGLFNAWGYGAQRGEQEYQALGDAGRAAVKCFAQGVAAITYALLYAAEAAERNRRRR